jgi:hypothetical protein
MIILAMNGVKLALVHLQKTCQTLEFSGFLAEVALLFILIRRQGENAFSSAFRLVVP